MTFTVRRNDVINLSLGDYPVTDCDTAVQGMQDVLNVSPLGILS